jgi:hypothetical protein
MALNSSYEMASAFGQAVDIAAAMPDMSFSHIGVHAEEGRPFVVLRLSPTLANVDQTRTWALTLADGWETEERKDTMTTFPDGTSVRIDEEGLMRFAEPRRRVRGLLAERSRKALYEVHHFAGSLALPMYCLGATLWPANRQPETAETRISSEVEVLFATTAEKNRLLERIGKVDVLGYDYIPAKPGRLPKAKWELELPNGGQSMTLFSVDRSPAGIAQERDVSKISRSD